MTVDQVREAKAFLEEQGQAVSQRALLKALGKGSRTHKRERATDGNKGMVISV